MAQHSLRREAKSLKREQGIHTLCQCMGGMLWRNEQGELLDVVHTVTPHGVVRVHGR
jgi:hypothetical protein